MSKIIFYLLTTLRLASGFFEYEKDCNPDCIHYKASCIVVEINPEYFVSQCTEDESTCEENASPTEVCLRPNDPPIGGKAIWPDYEKYKYHPRPNKEPDCSEWKIVSIVLSSFITLYAASKMFGKLISYLRTRRYEEISSVGEIYQETTQEIGS
jgi:hypothetical protein